MNLSTSPEGEKLLTEVKNFIEAYIAPNQKTFAQQMEESGDHNFHPPILEELKDKAKEQGLWNMFLPHLDPEEPGTKLSNVDYAYIAEQLGRNGFASEVFNCSAPDTGNMELMHLYGTEQQKQRWLYPLLDGEIRSAFAMTEPAVASSDATNIETRIDSDGNDYVINGRKWFISGAENPRCEVFILMGKTDFEASRHRQQSMILVPRNTPGITLEESPTVYGYHDRGGHPQLLFKDVRIPKSEGLLGEEGGGFAMSQARLGPGRIHHCMRSLGVAEVALEHMCQRAVKRTTFGKSVIQQGLIQDWIAESRLAIDQARLMCLYTAHLMDTVGNKVAANEISSIKVIVPRVTLDVLDKAIQVHGAGGVSQFFPLAQLWAHQRTLRIADGPDEVHKMTIARREIRKHDPDFRMSGKVDRPEAPRFG